MSSKEINQILSRLRDVETAVVTLQRGLAGVKNRLIEVERITDALKPLAALESAKEAEGRA